MDRDNKTALPNLEDDEQPESFEIESDIESDDVVSAENVPQLEDFIRQMLVEIQLHSYNRYLSSRRQLKTEIEEEEAIARSGKLKFRLWFCNQIASTIFTGKEIVAEDGKPLQVVICDATNFIPIETGPLSSAQIQFVVLEGEFGSDELYEEIHWTASDFNKNILSEREGRRPLIVGNNLKLYLKDGVGFINSLSFTDNSSWIKSKKFRLGAKVIDKKILAKFPRMGEAVSQPFRVMDHRGETNKKHRRPRGEDEVWRLKGISKDGVYNNRLSLKGIKTVDHFLKTYNEKGEAYLKKLLGNKVPNKIWKAMVENAIALEGDPITSSHPSFEQNLVGNEAMGGDAFYGNYLELQDYNFRFADYPLPLLPHGEASTSYSHSHGKHKHS